MFMDLFKGELCRVAMKSKSVGKCFPETQTFTGIHRMKKVEKHLHGIPAGLQLFGQLHSDSYAASLAWYFTWANKS